ncbi:MAG: 50S ribosomal protein L20 [Spirochaetes bacterium]|nr:50S ribosomal protein L20 [Spirochaetota bacterium]
MPRATTGLVHHKRQRKIMRAVKGYIGGRRRLYRTAKDAHRMALQHSYKDRKRKKREFRILWIARINAAARICGVSYSKLIGLLDKANIKINRKMLSEIAIKDFNAFKEIVVKAK